MLTMALPRLLSPRARCAGDVGHVIASDLDDLSDVPVEGRIAFALGQGVRLDRHCVVPPRQHGVSSGPRTAPPRPCVYWLATSQPLRRKRDRSAGRWARQAAARQGAGRSLVGGHVGQRRCRAAGHGRVPGEPAPARATSPSALRAQDVQNFRSDRCVHASPPHCVPRPHIGRRCRPVEATRSPASSWADLTPRRPRERPMDPDRHTPRAWFGRVRAGRPRVRPRGVP
jgi:hypothetical protein